RRVPEHDVGDAVSYAPLRTVRAAVAEHDRVDAFALGHGDEALGGVAGLGPAPDADRGEALGHVPQVPVRVGRLLGVDRVAGGRGRADVEDQELRVAGRREAGRVPG